VKALAIAALFVAGCGASPGQTDVAEVAVTAAPEMSSAPESRSSPPPRHAAQEPRARPSDVPPAPATSEEGLAKARALFMEGIKAFEQGDFATAEDRFSACYSLAPKPPVLFNLARVYMQEGKTREGCEAFERWWLSLSPPDPSKRSELPIAQCPNLASLP
jgi:hypothetical protein